MSQMRPQRPKRRKIRWTRLFLLLFILFTFVASLAWAAVYTYKQISAVTVLSTKVENYIPPEPETVGKCINILLLGVDDGDNENPGSPKRSDTMIVASINPQEGTVHLLSIPRDTKVAIPGHKGYEKITHAFFYGGAGLAVKTVEGMLEIPINHYVVIDWQAFIHTIDILGGIDLYVENNMNYQDPYANLEINLNKGYQHLDGNKAGQYVRFRSDELGDIGRVQRQQRFLKALTEQGLQFGNVLKLPALIKTMDQYVTTDITGYKMLKLANSLKTFRSGNMHTEMLPGNFATIDGLSYWVHDKERTKQLMESMFIGDDAIISGAISNSSQYK